MIKPARASGRFSSQQQPTLTAQSETFLAPVRGMVEVDNPISGEPLGARRIENGVSELDGVRVRGGSYVVSDCGAAVCSMFEHNGTHIFAATATEIFDVTALDPDTAPTSVVSGQTSGKYNTSPFTTVGGEYTYAVNGADDPQLFDGTTWQAINDTTTPAITGVNTEKFSHVWPYRNRLFFVERDSLVAWYLPVDSVGGSAQDFSLAGIFKRGGGLFFGATWSLDSGDGIDDKCVFVSTMGEVAVYQGSSPSDAATWSLVGVYDISEALGPKATMRAGGDLVISAVDGLLPLSQAIQQDRAALTITSISRPLERTWQKQANGLVGTDYWSFIKWPEQNIGIVANPNALNETMVVNLKTGAWSIFTGWDVQCGVIFNGRGFFADTAGKVLEMERGGTDDGKPYIFRCMDSLQSIGGMGAYKQPSMMRTTFLTNMTFAPKISAATENKMTFPTAPNAQNYRTPSEWDSGTWDNAIWDLGGDLSTYTTRWIPVSGSGFSLAPQVQITMDGDPLPGIRVISSDILYQGGAVVQ